ncbi:MAG: hypothetical protein SFU27_01015 [Thermonemataceae bacterium]|nr:hypothetical protein [Thermonemataceae bacterium]
METLTLKQNTEILEKNLSKFKGKFTLNDAAAVTGLPVEQARETLNDLMGKYLCHLQVSEDGDLIYDFGKSPTRRGAKTFSEIIDDIKNVLWKGFKIFFKAWIAATLVVYFIIFVVIAIAFLIAVTAANSKDDNRKSSDMSGSVFRFIGEIFYAIFRWQTISGAISYQKDSRGYQYKSYEPIKTNSSSSKNFIASVYDFVFGPPRVEPEPLANQQEVAAYARQNKGLMVLSEFKALAGWNTEQAQNFMTDCIARFNGTARISDNAILYADFYELTRSKTQAQDGKIEWYWDEFEPDYLLTGNSSSRNVAIAGLNLLNLAFSTQFLYDSEIRRFVETLIPSEIIFWALGIVPLAFSATFFAVPLLRWLSLIPKKMKRSENNLRKRLYRFIYQFAPKVDISLQQLAQDMNTGNYEKIEKNKIESLMRKVAIDWEGEAIPKDNGEVVYRFESLKNELEEIKKLRQQTQNPTNLGNIYFDTRD